ncbi:LuxR family transcriptional regulator [Bradyrhizobium barranii subsp. apii]|uniref:LuxR family transcriptional regulator n=1 Tax=Bradyrhizobium barranii subsp. apii TaxID=2819348 RepID=A0A8T5UY61_9BRAD|nr:LuxR family transcriptional regulator [Bradyrhizobium barranii]UPT86977.1 LuxR family transcriptional regulator [Bradyrhizobium barranii subsp. apii]
MHRVFQTFIDRLSRAEDVAQFSEAMITMAAALDLSCFAYLALPSQQHKKPLLISTYPPNWVAHYVRNHYQRFDPVIMKSLQNPEPFQWGTSLSWIHLSKAQQKLFDEASQFGIGHGFTVPIHDGHGPIAALTFARERRDVAFEHYVTSNTRLLQLMAMYFHAHVRRKLTHGTKIDGVSLSAREFECLEWAARGKSAWEIGRILGISRHTVASYLDNAKEKLGVRTIVQAASRFAAAKREEHN